MGLRSCLYRGEIMHRRLRPKEHRFTYPVTSWLIDLGELDSLPRRLRLFSHNRFNLVSFHDRDIGARDGTDPREWIDALMARHGIDLAGGAVLVHGFPRVLGIGFSPLTTWFCHHRDGRLLAVLYEVHNTFGEAHGYLAATEGQGRVLRHSAEKLFHVSPFLPASGVYHFALRPPGENFVQVIEEFSQQGDSAAGPILIASHLGKRSDLTDGALLRLFAALLVLPLVILGGIHWQAFKLFCKGIAFHRKPAPPAPISTSTNFGDFAR